jgi:ABC-type transport system substrate-binding protein
MASYWEKIARERSLSRRKLLGAGSAGLAGAALLAACGGDSSDTSGGGEAVQEAKGEFTPSDGQPVQGGTLLTTGAWIDSFHPFDDWYMGNVYGALVYDRPITTREDSRRYVLEAAESVETPDPLRAVIKLKPGLVYQNIAPVSGRAVKASDIEATQKYIISDPKAFDKTFVNTYLDRMEVTDDRTITFYLKRPNFYLFGMAALGMGTGQSIVPAEMLNDTLTSNSKPVGSGAYILDSAQLGVGGTYKKNPTYRDASKGLPYVDTIEHKMLTDAVAVQSAYRSGQIDFQWYVTQPQVANDLEKSDPGKFRRLRLAGIAYDCLLWNTTRADAPWKDVRVREAIWRLTNRQQLLELGANANGVIQDAQVPASFKDYIPSPAETAPYYVEDVQKAKQLLSAANFDMNKEVVFLTNANNNLATVYQQQLVRGGLKFREDVVATLGQRFQKIPLYEWDVMTDQVPGTGDVYIPMRMQHTKSWSDVYKGWTVGDASLDALIEKSEQTADIQENISLVKQVQMESYKRFAACYNWGTQYKNYVLSSRVQNYELSTTVPNAQIGVWLKG